MISDKGTIFKLSGFRVDAGGQTEISPEIKCASPSRILELKNSESVSSESSDGSEDLEALNELNLEDTDDSDLFDEEVGEKIVSFYNASVNDMDTGLSYDIPMVKCVQIKQNKAKKSRFDMCRLWTEKLKFTSARRIHGDRAEMVLHKQFGPRYSGRDFIVFKGEMAFSFKYPVCYPIADVNQTKWCL